MEDAGSPGNWDCQPILSLGNGKCVFGEGQDTSDTHQLMLVASPFLTFQHVANVVDRRSSFHNIVMNIGSDSMRISL